MKKSRTTVKKKKLKSHRVPENVTQIGTRAGVQKL